MDTAVGLVETYLRVNGYFTVTEYPVIEHTLDAGYQAATDVDILAFRFPLSRRRVAGPGGAPKWKSAPPHQALNCPTHLADMVIGEVKEGRAELNRGTTRTDVLQAVLAQFGCCDPDDSTTADTLRSTGRARTEAGHQVRLVAFGTTKPPRTPYHTVAIGDIVEFLRAYIKDNWDVLRQAQFKDYTLGMLALLHKVELQRHDAGGT